MAHCPVAAFFDLDRTLITVNSGRLWVARERRMGRVSAALSLRAALYFAAYRFGVLDMESAMGVALSQYVGISEQTLRAWTHQWWDEEVAQHAAPGAAEVLAEHRRKGHRLVLLTLSSPYISERAVEHFDLDEAISSRYEVRPDSRFTGRAIPPLCYGEGKVILSRRYAREHHLDLAESHFYSDSYSDLPMLEAVGHPHVINPDIRLRRVAERRGWPVEYWHDPGE